MMAGAVDTGDEEYSNCYSFKESESLVQQQSMSDTSELRITDPHTIENHRRHLKPIADMAPQ
jgi:hypothetical protein